MIGEWSLEKFGNKGMRDFVNALSSRNLSPKTVHDIVALTKKIVASAVTEEGDFVYPAKWNSSFIDMPEIGAQRAPTISVEALEKAIHEAPQPYAAFFALLAGSGLRLSEALALRSGPQAGLSSWVGQVLSVQTQMYKREDVMPKTKAGIRTVDICKPLADYLKAVLRERLLLFSFSKATAYKVARRYSIPGYHSLRRFRITHLRSQKVQELLIKNWVGHAGLSQTDEYVRISSEERRTEANRVELGFSLQLAMGKTLLDKEKS
jgi:integrase